MAEQSNSRDQVPGGNIVVRVLGWPLRQLLRFALDHPVLLESGTRLASKVPFVYNTLLRFAQRHSIVLAAEEPSLDPYEISDPDQLTEGGKEIFRQLKQACEPGPGEKP